LGIVLLCGSGATRQYRYAFLGGGMSGNEKITASRTRAAAAREIAKGIYDQDERRLILEVIEEFEKLTSEKARPKK
jgi:hypothetical protein